jgi:hypothetical protein
MCPSAVMTSTETTYESMEDARTAAVRHARQNGYAFIVQWPIGTITVQDRKPLLRSASMIVMECRSDGSMYHA